jgi:hypothetical protein
MSEEANREAHAADLAYAYDLSLPQARKLSDLAVNALDPTFAPGSPAHLADPDVAEAYVAAPLGCLASEESVALLDEVARRAIDCRFDTAGAWFARACVAEHRGDLAAQRAHLDASLARDAGFWPSLAAQGFLAFVEGDARRAGRLLAACQDERFAEFLHTLTHYPSPPPAAGRNQPCPCGSGKKHKHCCSGMAVHPLPLRASWLWDKAAAWLARLPQHAPVVEIAKEVAGVSEGDEPFGPDDPLFEAMSAVPMRAVVLLEGGLLQRFVERLGSLLPDDERALAETWTTVRHRVWRVDDTTPGVSLVLTDLAGGGTLEAVNGSVSRCTAPGEVVYGAVVPTSDGWLLPCHPTCLAPGDGDSLAELLGAGVDPMAVAATLVRGIRSATM